MAPALLTGLNIDPSAEAEGVALPPIGAPREQTSLALLCSPHYRLCWWRNCREGPGGLKLAHEKNAELASTHGVFSDAALVLRLVIIIYSGYRGKHGLP